jgi:hypothetical protein
VKCTARAGNRRFWCFSALRAHAKAPYKTDLHRKTLSVLNRPGRAPTVAVALGLEVVREQQVDQHGAGPGVITPTHPKVPGAKTRGPRRVSSGLYWVLRGCPGVLKGVRRGPVGPPGPLELAALRQDSQTKFGECEMWDSETTPRNHLDHGGGFCVGRSRLQWGTTVTR